METIRQRIARLHAAEEAVALRRHLHQYPDLSEQETPTMNLLCEKLDALGIPNPILLQRVCTHINVADGKALALSGIDSPDGILLERDASPALRAMERNVFTRAALSILSPIRSVT